MGVTNEEKRVLVDTLRRADPEAPTLCEGWNVRFLLAHLVQREQETRGVVADALAKPEPGHEKRLGRLAEAARTPEGYAALIDRFVSGAPRWSPFAWASPAVNLLEYTVHHEDVRRGAGPVPARTLPVVQQRSIAKQLRLTGGLTFRSAPVGVVLALLDGSRIRVSRGDRTVLLSGEPLELALYVSGRARAARVEVTGAEPALAAFRSWQQA